MIKNGETPVRANLREPMDKGKASEQAADAVGVSARIVEDAEYVHTHAPELPEKIKTGDARLYRTPPYTIARRPNQSPPMIWGSPTPNIPHW